LGVPTAWAVCVWATRVPIWSFVATIAVAVKLGDGEAVRLAVTVGVGVRVKVGVMLGVQVGVRLGKKSVAFCVAVSTGRKKVGGCMIRVNSSREHKHTKAVSPKKIMLMVL